jgi:hypothetical protein
MKRVARTVVGVLAAVGGVGAASLGVYEVLRGQWIWFMVIAIGGTLVLAGVRVATGAKVRDVVKDLLFVFMRTS